MRRGRPMGVPVLLCPRRRAGPPAGMEGGAAHRRTAPPVRQTRRAGAYISLSFL